jgi:hypothetical protein
LVTADTEICCPAHVEIHNNSQAQSRIPEPVYSRREPQHVLPGPPEDKREALLQGLRYRRTNICWSAPKKKNGQKESRV